ncbi:serine hydrolase [Dyadobacter sp. 32]|uniref:serine hydrolase n=1 Tax=Dyadobacter sp. 32 TaxID=538966 RepID=UPI0011EBC46E
MRNRISLFLFFALLTNVAISQTATTLTQKISAELTKHKGYYAVAFSESSSGKTVFINEREFFHAASTMKTPVMIEVFKQANAGKFSLTDSVTLKNEFKSIVDGSLFRLDSLVDSELVLYKRIGKKMVIRDLVYEMITVSSNFATNMLIDLVGAGNVTQSMRELGAKDMKVLRGVEDTKAFEKGLNNTTTAYDLMLIFAKMAQGEIVNQKASKAMIEILLDQKFGTVIPAKLPADVKVAHKTGAFGKVRHDSGIVYLPNGRHYSIVILSRDWEDEKETLELLSDVSKMIYDAVK